MSKTELDYAVRESIEVVRRKPVLDMYETGQISLPVVERLYSEWVAYDECVCLHRYEMLSKTHKTFAVKARKRGNDVHARFVNKRLAPILNDANGHNYYYFLDDNNTILNERTSKARTKMLFVTLEWNPLFLSVNDAWYNVGRELNKFRSRLAKKYGRIRFMRVYETHQSYYPHVHVLIGFEDYEFTVFKLRSELVPGRPSAGYRSSFRISRREMQHVKSCWSFGRHARFANLGFVDITAIQRYQGGMHYIVKYVRKFNKAIDATPPDSRRMLLRNMATQWLFGKRSFACSKQFMEMVRRDKAEHNSNRLVDKRALESANGFKIYRQLDKDGILCHFRYFRLGNYSWELIKSISDGSSIPFSRENIDLTELYKFDPDLKYRMREIELLCSLNERVLVLPSVEYPAWVELPYEKRPDGEPKRIHTWVCACCRDYYSLNPLSVRMHIFNDCRLAKSRIAALRDGGQGLLPAME